MPLPAADDLPSEPPRPVARPVAGPDGPGAAALDLPLDDADPRAYADTEPMPYIDLTPPPRPRGAASGR